MFFLGAILTLGLLGPAVLAAPAESPHEERATSCQTAFPVFARADESRPVESYLPGFIISQDEGATNKNDMFVEFNIPPGSYGCQLELEFPPGYPFVFSSGRDDIYVYSVEGPLSRTPQGIDVSWFTAPDPISQVGTITSLRKQVINSFVCKSTLTYRLSIGRDFTDRGIVSWFQSTEGGLKMSYNC